METRAAGPFEIIEILGEGSFGTVCVARYVQDGRPRKVALKILKGAYTRNEKIRKRTHDEASILKYINHPNIVRVQELTYISERPVVVMELVEGVSVDQLLLRFKTGLPASIAVEVVRQTLIALHVAFNEARGPESKPLRIIHRDIKPSNMLLSIRGELKVADFGIAKGEFDGREASTESVVLGSRPYMAPERLDGVDDHPTVDVYSCGMSLFELLTGRTMGLSINPVTHEQAMNRQLGYLHVPGMSEAGLEDLRGIIRRMCAYDRDYRPSALEAARELEQCFYAIDPNVRVTLEEFSRTTVLPIYESRPRIRPEDAVQDEAESEFIREVTGTIKTSTSVRPAPAPWLPMIIIAALVLLILILLPLAIYKQFFQDRAAVPVAAAPVPLTVEPVAPVRPSAAAPAPVAAAPVPTAPAPPTAAPLPAAPAAAAAAVRPTSTIPLVSVEFGALPARATYRIGDQQLVPPARVDLAPGRHIAVVEYPSGKRLRCTFDAEPGAILRLEADAAGGPVLHVSGRPGPPCEIVPR